MVELHENEEFEFFMETAWYYTQLYLDALEKGDSILSNKYGGLAVQWRDLVPKDYRFDIPEDDDVGIGWPF